MTAPAKQFCELTDPIYTFERIFRNALSSLVTDLSDAPWFLREREVINRIAFGHLVPKFQDENLDITQIAIEVPVLKSPSHEREKRASNGDLVIWPHGKATVWNRCKPLARIEWKNINCREVRSSNLRLEHRNDIERLQSVADLATLNYAVLTERSKGTMKLSCQKVTHDGPVPFDNLTQAGTGDESKFRKHSYEELTTHEQLCPRCRVLGQRDAAR